MPLQRPPTASATLAADRHSQRTAILQLCVDDCGRERLPSRPADDLSSRSSPQWTTQHHRQSQSRNCCAPPRLLIQMQPRRRPWRLVRRLRGSALGWDLSTSNRVDCDCFSQRTAAQWNPDTDVSAVARLLQLAAMEKRAAHPRLQRAEWKQAGSGDCVHILRTGKQPLRREASLGSVLAGWPGCRARRVCVTEQQPMSGMNVGVRCVGAPRMEGTRGRHDCKLTPCGPSALGCFAIQNSIWPVTALPAPR